MTRSELTCRNELIGRVVELISAERRRLERQRYEEEREANGNGHQNADGEGGDGEGGGDTEDGVERKKVPTGPMPEMERGLCVVCQDEEATLAVVDCGCV